MTSKDYHFLTEWELPVTCEEIYRLLSDERGMARWWPSLYRRVELIRPEGPAGIGKTLRVESRGFLPYTLHWSFEITEANFPNGFTLRAWGELEGTGQWKFEQRGETVHISYDWNVRAKHPLIQLLSLFLKPLFEANHNWVMRRGEEGLRKELEKLHT